MEPNLFIVPADALALAAVEGGGYISILKAVPVVLVLLVWARLLTWVDKDAPAAHLPRIPINNGMLGGLVAAFALFFLLPGFLIAFPVLLVVLGAEIGVYLYLRKKEVGLGDLKKQFNDWIKSFNKKKDVKEENIRVAIIAKSGQAFAAPAKDSPDRSAWEALQNALYEPLLKNADQIDMTPAAGEAFSIKYYVDGVSYAGPSVDRASGAGAIAMLKSAAGLDVAEVRKPQRGAVKLSVTGKRQELRLETAGSTAGEAARLRVDPSKLHSLMIEQLGFTPKQLEDVKRLVKEKQGIVLVANPKDMGLTTTLFGVIRAHDAFLEHIHTVERDPDAELTGITRNALPKNATPAEELKQIDWIISQEPDVILLPRVDDPRSAGSLIGFAKTKMAYIGMRAGDTMQALEQWRKLVGDDRSAVQNLRMVIAGRVLRKLCVACKVPYSPDPATLKKLGMSPERVTQLFQARESPILDQKGRPIPCTFCNDMKFKGRVGVYETMIVDEDVRAAVMSGGAAPQVKAAFRKQRGKFLLEEALGLVERGETSVQEVMRVMRAAETTGSRPPPQAAATARA
jgi:type II secretory ATPase GspE/PulE/Tfp pilus assembly ATPase PilB-like protein